MALGAIFMLRYPSATFMHWGTPVLWLLVHMLTQTVNDLYFLSCAEVHSMNSYWEREVIHNNNIKICILLLIHVV